MTADPCLSAPPLIKKHKCFHGELSSLGRKVCTLCACKKALPKSESG